MMSAADAFDLEHVSEYLQTTGMSESNRAACLRVIKKLITGKTPLSGAHTIWPSAPTQHCSELL